MASTTTAAADTVAAALVGCYGFASPPSNPADLSKYIDVVSSGAPSSVDSCATGCSSLASDADALVVIGQLLDYFVCGCAQNSSLFYPQDPSSCENKCTDDNEQCGSRSYSNRFSLYTLSALGVVSASTSSSLVSADTTQTGTSSSTKSMSSGASSSSSASPTLVAGTSASASSTDQQKYLIPLLVSLAVLVLIGALLLWAWLRRRRKNAQNADLPQLPFRPIDLSYFTRRYSRSTATGGSGSRPSTLTRDMGSVGGGLSLPRSSRRRTSDSLGRIVEEAGGVASLPRSDDDDAIDVDGYGRNEPAPPLRNVVATTTAPGYLIGNLLPKTPQMRYDVRRAHDPNPARPYRGAGAGGGGGGGAREIALRPGQVVKVACGFNDGWALGLN
ncbi:hypothetical protein HK405_010379, partial [Cladochytrium tenue]